MSTRLPGAKPGVDSPGRVGNDESTNPEARSDPNGGRHDSHRVALVGVEAAELDKRGPPPKPAEDVAALVACHASGRKAGNGGELHAHRLVHDVGQGSEPGSGHDDDLGIFRDAGSERLGRPVHLDGRGGPVYISIPAMAAVMNAASVPPTMARSPRRARSSLRSGAIPPIPPSWIAIDEKLANPDSA